MKTYFFPKLILILIIMSCNRSLGGNEPKVSEAIRINQIGFYPEANKQAVITDLNVSGEFMILDTKDYQEHYKGNLSNPVKSEFSNKENLIANFSEFQEEGEYCVYVPGIGCSPPFKIEKKVFSSLATASIKSFYFQRASTALEEKYAGKWSRPAGHPDEKVQIHASAASQSKPEGTIISAPLGWYDAGDYNKYIVNSGITMATLMALVEDFPQESLKLKLSIPESSNDVPDIIDELLWNLKWMKEMQDTADGGVYHKLTTANFEGMVLPHEATNQRYVVAKSTAATLDFAAVMAQASRLLKDVKPDLSAAYLKAAELAWSWAKANPNQLYQQNEMNKKFKPEIQTGAYGDNSVTDEWIWAACELFISTHNLEYLKDISEPQKFDLPSWNSVAWLGYYSLLRFKDDVKQTPSELVSAIRAHLFQEANLLVDFSTKSAYRSPMGRSAKDFVWGSNAVASNQAIALIYAYRISNDRKYLNAAIDNLDYILGKNATGYSYVTGFGYKTPQRPHHRLAEAEPEKEPLPGFMVGGPNPGQQDGCNYTSSIPDESFVDEACSYASNEIAINWNAPFAYVVNALEFVSN